MMKTMIKIAAVAAVLAPGVAMADPPINVGGQAEAVCTLPTSWSIITTTGVPSSTWTGTTWTIPENIFADANSMAVTGGEYAIRVTGEGFCNTSHKIRLESVRGGLSAGATGEAPPAGFANRRRMAYEAYWYASGSGGTTTAHGPKLAVNGNVPGASHERDFVVSDTLAPPGNRRFDVRMGLPRGAVAEPLVAGAYSDEVVVTITVQP